MNKYQFSLMPISSIVLGYDAEMIETKVLTDFFFSNKIVNF